MMPNQLRHIRNPFFNFYFFSLRINHMFENNMLLLLFFGYAILEIIYWISTKKY